MNWTNWVTTRAQHATRNTQHATRARNAIGSIAIIGCLMYTMSAVANTDAECQQKWDDSPASAYCTDTSVEVDTREPVSCRIAVSSCSITVNIGTGSTTSYTFTPPWHSDYSIDGIYFPDVAQTDICFRAVNSGTDMPQNATSAQGGWVAVVGAAGGCSNLSTDSATATSNGLAGP